MQWHWVYGQNCAEGVEVVEYDGLIHKICSFMITWCLRDYETSRMRINVVCGIAILPNVSDLVTKSLPPPTLDYNTSIVI